MGTAGAEAQHGFQSASQSGRGTGTTTQRPTTPEGWVEYLGVLKERTPEGLSPQQKEAEEYYRGRVGAGPATGDFGPGIEYLKQGMDRGSFTSAQLRKKWPELYKDAPGRAGEVEAGRSKAARTLGYVPDYQSGFQESVIDTTLARLKRAQEKGESELRAQYGGSRVASGGEATGREQVAAGEMKAENILGQAQVVADLSEKGYQSALREAEKDAAKATAAAMQDASLATQASISGAGLETQASLAEADRDRRLREFDVEAARLGEEARGRSAREYADLESKRMETGRAEENVIDNLMAGISESGQTGIDNALKFLGIDTARFGQKTDTEYETSGRSKGKATEFGASTKFGLKPGGT